MDWDELIRQVVGDDRMPSGTMVLIAPRYRLNELGGKELDEEATVKASVLVTNIGQPRVDS